MHSNNRNAAILAMGASAILSFIDNFVFAVSQEAGLWQFQVGRTICALPVLLAWAAVTKTALWPENPKKTVLRSLIISTGLLIYFAALGVLPVAQAAAGLFTSPLWLLAFSAAFFAVRVRGLQIVLMGLGFIGALMLLQPDLGNLGAATITPIVAGAFYGLGMLVTRHWCEGENVITLAIGVFVTIGSFSAVMLGGIAVFGGSGAQAGFLMQGWVAPTVAFMVLTFGQAIGAVVAVTMITQAYRIGEPSFVAMFEYSFLVFAALWAFLLWGQTIDTVGIAGIVVILVAGVALSVVNRRVS